MTGDEALALLRLVALSCSLTWTVHPVDGERLLVISGQTMVPDELLTNLRHFIDHTNHTGRAADR